MKLQKCLFLVFFGFGILTNAGAWSSFDDLTIIPPNSIWNYNDQGIDLGSIWTISTFNDNNWNAGKGIFGYGMDNISTQLDFGLQEQNKIITYYFRKSFELTSLNSINSLKLSVLRDDGIAVYLNGNLVVRNNLPEEFDYLTLAQESVPAADQQNYIHYSVDAEFLVLGKNTIAVEVHQANAESSDLGFDLYCTLSSDLPRNIVINEVMSGNHSAFIDPQTNQFSDYIELFNASSDVVDLSGYYLSDSKTKHKKWRIPENTVINPDGYILFFADGTDTINHTSFRTSLTGELIGLYDPDGFPVDTIDLPQQYFDISYGRDPNDLGKLQYFANPTAGTENSDGVNLIEQAGRVQFSNEGGFYSGSLQLQLETNSAEGVIRYTTDGGTPRFNSSRYSSTIAIDETTVIKAKVFEPGLLPGETISNTYFINEDISLPVFSISTEDDYLYDNSVGIYLDANVATRKPWERPATLEFFEPDGVRGIVADVDIRLFGRGAINFPEKSLAIYARQSLGVGYINYPLFSHMPLNFFESFLLRSSSDDWRYTLFRDGMIQSIVQDQLNIDVQAYRPSILFLNGEYMGIHNIREKYNENYLASHHGVDPENLDVLFIDNDDSPASIEIISGDVGAYKTLLNFVTTADLSKDENYEMVASLMDIDNYIDYIIVQVISSNRSWRHNRRVWRPKTPDGKFKWLLFDLDYGYSFIDLDVLEQLGENDPLMSHLIENEDFTDRFISRLLVVDQTVFHPDRVIHYIDSLAAQIDGQIDRHLDRWGGTWPGMITSKADWKKKVQVMRDYATNRPSITRNYLEDFFNLAGDIDGVFSIIPENSGRIVEDGIEIDHDQSITKFAKDIPLSFEAVPTPGFKFNGWNSGVSSGTSIVLSKSEWKYLDDGSNQGTAWIGVGFDDNSWSSGNANLGFQNENDTDINSGHITYYFRKEFEVIDLNQYSKLNLDLLRDDGAVVYLNGVEVYRSNMPSGVIDFQTYASTMAGWVDERTYHHTELAIDLLVSGTNTFAVEVHQDVPSSNDLSFDLALSGVTEGKSLENPVTIVTANDFNLAAEFVKVTESQVVISEIAYNPPDNNGGTEAGFIEVSNIGDHSIDISGYAFTVGISYVFPVGTILEAKEKLLVVKNLNNFNTIQGQVFQWTSGNLSTNGETLKINSPNGDIVDEVSYSINAPWPEKGSLNGASVELLNLGDDNNNGNNWRASQGAGGTPTIINSIALANLSINEFLTLPESEGYLKNTDWIEIYNGNDKPIDVGGLYLSDDPLDPLKWMIPFGFPDESTVEPGEVLLFLADNQPDLGFKHCGFKIGGNSGDIVISMGFIDWVTQIDHINYGLQAQGKSNGRFPNGDGEWLTFSDPSPDQLNRPGSKYIIVPHTCESGDWVPIYAKVLNEDGSVDYTFHGEKTIDVGSAAVEPSIMRFTKGVGYAVVKLTANKDVEIRVEDLDDVAFIHVVSDIPVVTLSPTYNTDLTLTSGVNYFIEDELTIGEFGSLTIEKGVRIRFGSKANIISNGPVFINGTPGMPVVFMPHESDEKWGGLEIRDHDGLSVLNHAFFFHGGSDPSRLFFHTETQAVVRSSFADICMFNCYIFENIGKGFGSESAEVIIDECLFATSAMGPEFRQSYSLVDHTWIVDIPDPDRERTGNDNDGIYFWKDLNDEHPPSRLDNSVVANIEDDAIDMLASDIEVYNTLFFEIMDKASSCGYWSDASFDRCLIIGCNAGIVPGWWSDAKVSHTTFYETSRPVKNSIFGATEVWNSILSKFSDVAWNDDLSNEPTFYYSLSDTKVLPGENNLLGDPKFIGTGVNSLHLKYDSPAIDKGDPEFEPDPDGTRPDIGKFSYQSTVGAGAIVVNEIYYNPSASHGKDSDFEFIELYNPYNEATNISGYQLQGAIDFTFPFNTWLNGGEYLILTANAESYKYLDNKVFDWGSEKLSNTGETLTFIDVNGKKLAEISYSGQDPWSPLADGNGFSLELSNPGDDNSAQENWRSSYEAWGTPGELNRVPDFTKVKLNEILVNNNSVNLDDRDKHSAWIEVYNGSDAPINIGGYIIRNENSQMDHQIPISDAFSTLIPSGDYIILYLDGLTGQGLFHTSLLPDVSGGMFGLYHLDFDGVTLKEIDKLDYPAGSEDISFGRFPDGSPEVQSFAEPTPRSSNVAPSENLIAPKIFSSGQTLPVLVRYSDPDLFPETMNRSENIELVQQSIITDQVYLRKGLGLEWITPSMDEDVVLKLEDDSHDLTFDSHRPIRIRSEKILRSQVWTADYDYEIISALNIPANATLTIEAGTRIFIKKYANITVEGQIQINGVPGNPVVILPLAAGERWGGIQIHSGYGSVNISHCFLVQGGKGISKNPGSYDKQAVIESERPLFLDNVYMIELGGKGVHVKDAKLEMHNSVLYNCLSGIELENSPATITGSHFMYLPNNDNPNPEDNQDAITAFGFDGSVEGQITISGSYFYKIGDDGCSFITDLPVSVRDSYFDEIEDKALSAKQSPVDVRFSVIEQSDIGIELDHGSSGDFDHITFYQNRSAISLSHSDGSFSGANAHITNSIIAQSEDQDFKVSDGTSLSAEFNLSTGDNYPGLGNITGNPRFVEPSTSDFRLSNGSVAINNGDPAYANDDDGSRTDIGRYTLLNGASIGNLMITEIHYLPSDPLVSTKFVEIHNMGSGTVDLDGYSFGGDVSYTFSAGYEVGPGDYFVVCQDVSVFAGQDFIHVQWTDGDLPIENGEIILMSPDGDIIDEIIYNDSDLWSQWPMGKGPSLEFVETELDNSTVHSWRNSYYIGGTPGRDNSIPPMEDLYINEFMARNLTTFPDEFDFISDWIEFYNGSNHFITLNHLFITRDFETPDMYEFTADHQDSLFIPPGGYLVVHADELDDAGAYHLSFLLSGSGGQIGLYSITNGIVNEIEGLVYPEQTGDVSYGRSSDGHDTWTFFSSPTPGRANGSNISGITGVYINEIMARNSSVHINNVGLYDDWIELYNSNSESINIGGLYITDRESDLTLWQIPETNSELTTIPGKGYLMIYPSGDPALGVQHTNFQLAGSGEYVALSQVLFGINTIIDEVSYGAQTSNISYGREEDGDANWVFFDSPTPLQSNLGSSSANYNHQDIVQWLVYPNPASELLHLQIQLSESSLIHLNMTNMYGYSVYSIDLRDGLFSPGKIEKTINIRNFKLSPGYYFITLRIGEKSETRRIVVY